MQHTELEEDHANKGKDANKGKETNEGKEANEGKCGTNISGLKRKIESEWTHTLSVRVFDSDAALSGGGGGGEGMVVHPLVLGKRSVFFGCLDDNGRQELVFSVPGGMRMFSVLVEYLYSGTLLQPLDTESAVLLFYLAYKYDVAALMDLCRSWWVFNCFRRSPIQISLRPRTAASNERKDDPPAAAAAATAATAAATAAAATAATATATSGETEWYRINRRLLEFLKEVHRRPEVLEVFARVKQVDNTIRDELFSMGEPDRAKDFNQSILELAWFHLALQIWSECHRGPDRNPLILHGATRNTTPRSFPRLMDIIQQFLPSNNPLLLLRPLQLVELKKLHPAPPPPPAPAAAAAPAAPAAPPQPPPPVVVPQLHQAHVVVVVDGVVVAGGGAVGGAVGGGEEERSVYRMRRLAPMSREARMFVSRCQLGKELGKRIYSIDQLPSVTATAASILFCRLLSRRKQALLSLDVTSAANEEVCLNVAKEIAPYLGAKTTVSQLLSLMTASVDAIDSRLGCKPSFQEGLSDALAERNNNATMICAQIAVLAAYDACDLLLNWDCGSVDVFSEFQKEAHNLRSPLWSVNALRLLLDLGCTRALKRQRPTFSDKSDDYGTLFAKSDGKDDNKNNSITVPMRERYQRLCVCLLDGFTLLLEHNRRLDLLEVLCTSIRFDNFRTHDQSWNLLHQVRRNLLHHHHEEKTTDRLTKLLKVVDGALKQHRNMSLESVKRWCSAESGTDYTETMLRILTCDEREHSLIERAREHSADHHHMDDHWFVGQVIDVADVEFWSGRWCPCEILACRTESNGSHHLYVKYIGWSSYYNRWINTRTEAHRLAPLGQHSTERSLYGPERPPPSPRQPPPPPPPAVVAPVAVPVAVPVAGPLPPAPVPLPLALPLVVVEQKSDDEDYDDWD